MNQFEDAMHSELGLLLRAQVPSRGIRITVREMLVSRIERGPLGARAVSDSVAQALRAACRLMRELHAPEDVVDTVCAAAFDAIRGHGGHSARWMPAASDAAVAVLSSAAADTPDDADWQWLLGRVQAAWR